jgi:hypothetical protein
MIDVAVLGGILTALAHETGLGGSVEFGQSLVEDATEAVEDC